MRCWRGSRRTIPRRRLVPRRRSLLLKFAVERLPALLDAGLRRGRTSRPASVLPSAALAFRTASIRHESSAPAATAALPARTSTARLRRATVVSVGEPSTAQPRQFNPQDIPHDRMRLTIAENMARAVAEQPHVTAVFEADFSAIAAHKAAMAASGMKLSYTAYIVKAAAEAMAVAPAINGRWEKDRIAISPTIDIGIGTALGEKGLVVPVVKDCGSLSLEQIGAKLDDLTAPCARRKARALGRVGRKLHHLESRRVRLAACRADHPASGTGRDPRRRQAPEAGRRARR